MSVQDPRKAAQIQEFRRHERDNGSTPVQVAVLTSRIRHLTAHLKQYPKDHATRRGLLKLVGQRARLLRYYARSDAPAYRELIGRLGLRR